MFPIAANDIEALSKCPVCDHVSYETISEVFNGFLKFLTTVLCRQCGFVYRQTRPNLEWFFKSWSKRDSELRSDAQYNESTLLEKKRYIRYGRTARFIEDKIAGRSILDVGSGPGTGLKAFRDRGWDVTGLEPDPSRAKIGREQHGLNIIESHIENFEGNKDRYSLVTVIHVLEHFHSPVNFMKHLVRQVADNGFVYIEVPNLMMFVNWKDSLNLEHMNNFTKETLGFLLKRVGLTPEHWVLPKTTPFGVTHLGVFCQKSSKAASGLSVHGSDMKNLSSDVSRLYNKGLLSKKYPRPLRFWVDSITNIASTVESHYYPKLDHMSDTFHLQRSGRIIRGIVKLHGLGPLEILHKLLSKYNFDLIRDNNFNVLRVMNDK